MADTAPAAASTDAAARNPDVNSKAFARNPGRKYSPSAGSSWSMYPSAVLDGAPVFTWLDIPRMLRDPQVQFGLRMLRSPFASVKWKIHSDHDGVARFVDKQFRRFWKRIVPRMLLRYHSWGFAAAALEYQTNDRAVKLLGGKVPDPSDVTPLLWSDGTEKGRFAGFELKSKDGPKEKVGRPHALWFGGHEELGLLYDRPRIAGAFEPWLEKRGRNGAVQSRRLWFRKAAFDGGTLYHPFGLIDFGTPGNPDWRYGQDLAREILETAENGGSFTFPNAKNPQNPSDYLWDHKPPTSRPDVAGVRDYPKDLDAEILVGLGIPPEVLEASEVGSGWSGRMVPAMAYFGSADETAMMLADMYDEGSCRPMVRQNFGRRGKYEVELLPLAETLLGQGPKQQVNGGGPGAGPPQPDAQTPPPTAPVPDPANPPAGDPAADPADLSFTAEQTRTGHVKAVGAGEDTGTTLYGDDAKRALSARVGDAAKAVVGKADKIGTALRTRIEALPGGHAILAGGKVAVKAFKAVERPLFYAMHKTQQIAVAAAKERGLSDDQAAMLKRALAVGDFLGGYVTGAAGAAVGGAIGAKVGSLLPSASAAYLAYSTARDPRATWRAARSVVQETLGIHGKPIPAVNMSHENDPLAGLAGRIADAIKGMDPQQAEWYVALIHAALPETSGEFDAAVDIADKAMQRGGANDLGSEPISPDVVKMLSMAMIDARIEGKDDELDGLAELAGDPAALKHALASGKNADLAWTEFGQSRSGKPRWKDSSTGEVRYQKSRPGSRAEATNKARASGSTAMEIVGRINGGKATAQDLDDFATHVQALTTAQLQTIRGQLGAAFGKEAKTRDAMIGKLRAHARGIAPAEPPPSDPKPGEAFSMPVEDIHVDPARFQFKLNTNNPSGTTDELKTVRQWNPDFAGVVSVWKDPDDGKTYVVNGHHRHELASRLGANRMDVRYIDAPDAKTARAKGALINIAEGRGTAIDAAKFMRDTGVTIDDFAKHGVPMKAGALADQATALTRLNDKAFDRLTHGDLDIGHALAVAKHLVDPVRQERLFKIIEKKEDEGKSLATRTVEEMARTMAAVKDATTTENTLFGFEENTEDTFVQRAELAGYVRAELAKELTDFAVIASERRAGRVESAGNVLAVEANKHQAELAERAKNLYDLLANRKGPIAEALNDGAVKLAQAKTKKERERVRNEAADAVRAAVRAELGSETPVADGEGRAIPGDQGPSEPAAAPTDDAGRGNSGPGGLEPEPLSPHWEQNLFGVNPKAGKPANQQGFDLIDAERKAGAEEMAAKWQKMADDQAKRDAEQ